MPDVEVAKAQITKETGKAAAPGNEDGPPGPGLTSAHWKLHQVPICDADSQQRSAKRHSIVEHEFHHPQICHRPQLLGIEAKRVNTLRQEVAGERLENGKAAAEYQHEGRQCQQEPDISCFRMSTRLVSM